MSWLPDIKRRILGELRHGGLDQFQISAGIAEAPFRVRAELQDLKRDRLIYPSIRDGHIVWTLTVRGERTLLAAAQIELGGI
jgi:hypothetical protein